MKNTFLRKVEKIVKVRILGRNVSYYIATLYKKNIHLFDVDIISRKEAYIKLYYKDYLDLINYKSTYEVSIYKNYGILRIYEYIKKNYILFIFLVIGTCLSFFLSKIIFDIEIITSNSKIKSLVASELKNHGIYKYQFKKDYHELKNIINEILEDNKDDLEWLEIKNVGNKYIVNIQIRKKKDVNEEKQYQNIVASKSGIILDIDASHGEIIKKNLDYVTKGDVIISGNILLPDGTSSLTNAIGKVYAEVWYKVKASYPYIYKEESYTGKAKKIYVINFLNKRISLFDYHKYNSYITDNKIILSNYLLPINLTLEKQYEMKVIDEAYTKEEAIEKAVALAKDKLLKKIDKASTIKSEKIIMTDLLDNGVMVEVFYSVIEQIGSEEVISLEEKGG